MHSPDICVSIHMLAELNRGTAAARKSHSRDIHFGTTFSSLYKLLAARGALFTAQSECGSLWRGGHEPDCFGGSPVHNRSVSLASTRGFSSGIHGALVTVASSSRALRRRKPAERVVPWMCEREKVIVP